MGQTFCSIESKLLMRNSHLESDGARSVHATLLTSIPLEFRLRSVIESNSEGWLMPSSQKHIRCIFLGLCSLGLALECFADEISFSRDIQPVLARRCFACHGPADQESGLALHNRSLATAETESGEIAIVPGDPGASVLLQRVSSDDESVRMPPEGEPLSAKEIELLRKWIASGAEYEPHWSFVVPQRPTPPNVLHPEHARNPIDNFVLSKLDAIELAPAPRANSAKLIRRLYLDLTGLLPDAEEVASFENNETTYTEIVDELLASDHFGERWGRHWLDLARYADSFGYERDDVRPNAWRYRDWVIQSFNHNQPYDQFVIEQLAGDLLDDPSLEQRIATGLHRMNIKNNESGINKEDYRNREMVDRINTTSTAMLGLTLGCCQCHAHKYDPFSHSDYYQLYAFFNNVEPKNLDIEGTDDEQQRYQHAKADLDAHRKRLDARKKLLGELRKHESFVEWRGDDTKKIDQLIERLELDESLIAALKAPEDNCTLVNQLWESLRGREDDVDKAKRQLSVEERHLPKPYIMTLEERPNDRRTTHVLERGDFKSKGEEVHAATPRVLPPLTTRDETADRLDLARWITSRDNPLAARVAVNHIWKHLFGRGIVSSVDDFGTQGELPTHPQLLDWLTLEFMDSGWDRKHLIRTIVHSATYQQSSRMRQSKDPRHQLAFGPDNQLFARQSRFRVESEVVRDMFLHASGLLSRELGGPTVHPMIPAAVTDLAYKYKTQWIVSKKPHRYRRGLYIHFKRTNPYPTLLMFDGPESNVCQAMRTRSNTPLQALATLNDPVFVECAQGLGQTLAKMRSADEGRLDWLARRTLSRPLESRESEAIMQLFAEERDWYREHSEEATRFVGDYSAERIENHETAAWIAVARTVLNLDEFVTRE